METCLTNTIIILPEFSQGEATAHHIKDNIHFPNKRTFTLINNEYVRDLLKYLRIRILPIPGAFQEWKNLGLGHS